MPTACCFLATGSGHNCVAKSDRGIFALGD